MHKAREYFEKCAEQVVWDEAGVEQRLVLLRECDGHEPDAQLNWNEMAPATTEWLKHFVPTPHKAEIVLRPLAAESVPVEPTWTSEDPHPQDVQRWRIIPFSRLTGNSSDSGYVAEFVRFNGEHGYLQGSFKSGDNADVRVGCGWPTQEGARAAIDHMRRLELLQRNRAARGVTV